jgi:hypothetical protein
MAPSGHRLVGIAAATPMTSAPLLAAFLLLERQFVQSFMRARILLKHDLAREPASTLGSSPRASLIML